MAGPSALERQRGLLQQAVKRTRVCPLYLQKEGICRAGFSGGTSSGRLLFRGDPFVLNVYHALCQPEGATSGAALAAKFVDFLASEKAQTIIRDYGKDRYGEALYRNAEYARQFE